MKKIVFLLLLCLVYPVIKAQESNNELLKKLVEKNVLTQEEASQLMNVSSDEKKNAKQQIGDVASKVREVFNNTPYVKLGGYGLLTYKYNEFSKNHHDFRPRVVFISMNGKLTKTISYGMLAEFVNPTLYEYYAEWSPVNYFKVKAGQFKVPFTLENPISLTNIETIYNTRTISNLAGMGDDVVTKNKINGAGRDIGIQASGSLLKIENTDLIQYWAGIFQGGGINATDLNNDKDFAGMLMFQPLKGFRLGGGAYFGEASYALESETEITKHVRNRWTISTDYLSDRFYARAEWINGKDGVIEKEGLYGTALYYLVPDKLNIVAKVDYFNKNKKVSAEVVDYTCGLNYYFYPQCRFQLNYTYSDYSDEWGSRNTNMVAAQMQIVF